MAMVDEQGRADASKRITFRMAPDGSYYQGKVMRVVTRDLGGQQHVLSETSTGLEYDEFTELYPTEPVDGRSATNLADDLRSLSDEKLAKLGLKRMDDFEPEPEPEEEEEDLSPTYIYPVDQGYSWYLCSDGKKVQGKAAAKAYQAKLDGQEED